MVFIKIITSSIILIAGITIILTIIFGIKRYLEKKGIDKDYSMNYTRIIIMLIITFIMGTIEIYKAIFNS